MSFFYSSPNSREETSVSQNAPKLRFWQSSKKTLKAAESGFDALKVLAKAKEPLTVSDLMRVMGHSRNSVTSAYVSNALLALHKVGAIQGDGKVSRLRVTGDLTKVSITPAGRQLLQESRSRLEFGKRLLERS